MRGCGTRWQSRKGSFLLTLHARRLDQADQMAGRVSAPRSNRPCAHCPVPSRRSLVLDKRTGAGRSGAMDAGIRAIRPLTPATFGPALLSVLALPFGFIEEGVAVVAGVYGLYFALPATVAWGLDVVRSRLPPWGQRTLGVLILLVTTPAIAFWLFWIGPLLIFAAPPAAVVVIVTWRLLLARPVQRPTAMEPQSGTRTARASG